jgi:hypothetical protein
MQYIVLKFDSSSGLYIVDIHEVFGRVGNMQARNKTGHGKIDPKNCFSCTRENKLDKKLVKEILLVCAGL